MNLIAMTAGAHWSLGVLIGLPLAAIVLIGLFGLGVLFASGKEWGVAAGFFLAFAVFLAFLLSPLGYYPYKAEYHQWQPHGGTVASIDKRLMGGSDNLEEKFVVRFEGSPQQYGCSDTRCASVHPGDRLSLTCKKDWEYAAVDGYNCRFVSTEAAR